MLVAPPGVCEPQVSWVRRPAVLKATSMHGCFTNGETARRGDLLRGVNYVGHLWLLSGGVLKKGVTLCYPRNPRDGRASHTFRLKTKRSVSGKCPQEGRRKTELLQQRDQTREDIAFRESWEDQMPSLQRMILKAAAERAGKPAARVQGYWPVGRLRKRELGTECLVLNSSKNHDPARP